MLWGARTMTSFPSCLIPTFSGFWKNLLKQPSA